MIKVTLMEIFRKKVQWLWNTRRIPCDLVRCQGSQGRCSWRNTYDVKIIFPMFQEVFVFWRIYWSLFSLTFFSIRFFPQYLLARQESATSDGFVYQLNVPMYSLTVNSHSLSKSVLVMNYCSGHGANSQALFMSFKPLVFS